jgi:hypothetical protein
MTLQAIMPGPDGVDVTCYKRSRRQVTTGDYLHDYGAHAVSDAVDDPDDGSSWVTLDDGRDIRLTVRKVWLFRRYAAPAWMTEALETYRAARDAREALRESSEPVPPGLVAGAANSGVAWCQLETADFNAAYPAPRLADFIRDAAAARREMVSA